MQEISKLFWHCIKKYQGIVNIGRGQGVHLKDIAKIICLKYKKRFQFEDNERPSYLITNNSKLKII